MWPPAVVVLGVGPKRLIEVSSTEDEGPVETLGPDGLDHPFRVGVRIRGPDRGPDHPRPFRANDLIEGMSELGVLVADEEPDGG